MLVGVAAAEAVVALVGDLDGKQLDPDRDLSLGTVVVGVRQRHPLLSKVEAVLNLPSPGKTGKGSAGEWEGRVLGGGRKWKGAINSVSATTFKYDISVDPRMPSHPKSASFPPATAQATKHHTTFHPDSATHPPPLPPPRPSIW